MGLLCVAYLCVYCCTYRIDIYNYIYFHCGECKVSSFIFENSGLSFCDNVQSVLHFLTFKTAWIYFTVNSQCVMIYSYGVSVGFRNCVSLCGAVSSELVAV